jgi:hypothetical protein
MHFGRMLQTSYLGASPLAAYMAEEDTDMMSWAQMEQIISKSQ